MDKKINLGLCIPIYFGLLMTQVSSHELRRPLPDDVEKLFSVRVYRYSCDKRKYDGGFACKFDLGPIDGHENARKIVERALILVGDKWQFCCNGGDLAF